MTPTSPTFRAGTRYSAPYNWAGYALGFAMGGLFDGILLRQVLQWHHLLSGARADRFGDIRTQIMADGLFQAIMYVVAMGGLYLLVRARADLCLPRAGRRVLANFWMGFGAVHVLDAVIAQWILGLHHVRMEDGNRLAWDIGWFFVFGLVPLLAALRLRRPPAAS